MKQPQDTTTIWYAAETGNHQGLIICEKTGNTIAVAYDKANAPLLALAPQLQDSHRDLLQELESAEDGISRSLSRLRNADYDDGEHPAVSAEILALHAVELAARAAIAKARGLDT